MPRLSAGLLMFRTKEGVVQVLLAHPGSPYFVKKSEGSRIISKGGMVKRICSLPPNWSSRGNRHQAHRAVYHASAHQAKGQQDRSRLGHTW